MVRFIGPTGIDSRRPLINPVRLANRIGCKPIMPACRQVESWARALATGVFWLPSSSSSYPVPATWCFHPGNGSLLAHFSLLFIFLDFPAHTSGNTRSYESVNEIEGEESRQNVIENKFTQDEQ